MSDLKYFLLTGGVWTSFLVFGYLQEKVTRQFEWTEILVLLQSLTNVFVSGLVLLLTDPNGVLSGGVKWSDWSIVGLGYFGAHAFGLAALKHIIYPLQVVIKSCKAIPVLIGEMVFARSRPSLGKILAVVQLSGGVGLFMFFSDLRKSGGQTSSLADTSMVYGVSLAVGALVCDAVYGPYQNRICQRHNPSAWHLMFNMNLYQLGFALLAAVKANQLQPAWQFMLINSATLGPQLLGFCLSMTVGNIFIYQMQRNYGALAVAKTTTVRKLVSVSLSVLLFGHTLGRAQLAAMAVVFLAPVAEKFVDKLQQARRKEDKAAATDRRIPRTRSATRKTKNN